jgi:hypothetical protein
MSIPRSHLAILPSPEGSTAAAQTPCVGCGCSFGVCTRVDPVAGDHDWCEPNEPALERDGLPWFYFIPSADKLAPEFHERYQRESQALWARQPDAELGDAADGGGV